MVPMTADQTTLSIGRSTGIKKKAPSECPHCGTVYVHNDGLRKHLRVGKKCKKLREAFPALAALALVAAQADLNVTRLLEQLQAESQSKANV